MDYPPLDSILGGIIAGCRIEHPPSIEAARLFFRKMAEKSPNELADILETLRPLLEPSGGHADNNLGSGNG